MKNNNFITIQGWMVNDLRLSGNELICYALIYGFTQDEESEFRGSLQYISDWLGISKQNVRLIIKRLVEKGLIIKRDEFINNVKFCRYTVCMKQPHGINVSCIGGGNETATDNNSNNNKDNKEDTNVSKKVSFSPTEEEKNMFEEFRKKYPGNKRGLKTELDLLVKKHKDWRDIIPVLNKAIDVENRKRKEAKDSDSFYPNPKNLQTYINNRAWEAFADEPYYDENEYHPSTNGSDVRWNEPSQCYICFYPWAFDNLCDGYTKDTRPDNATVYCQGRKYVWSKKQQKWEHD
jgi:DNA-binding Lrp family transcriptional regulator